MIKYLVIQKLRAAKILLKNYTGGTIALLITACISIAYAWNLVAVNAEVIQNHTRELLIGICLIQAAVILFQKRLVIRIHPASIRFFYNSDEFIRIVRFEILKKIITKIPIAAVLALVLTGLCPIVQTVWLGFLLFIFLSEGSTIAWMKYNRMNPVIWLGCYAISGAGLVMASENGLWIWGMCAGVIAVLICGMKTTHVDMGQYYDDALSEERTDCAGRYADMAQMQQIMAEQKANKQYKLKFDGLLRKREHALLWKVITELYRSSAGVKMLLIAPALFAVLINRTNIAAGIPFLEYPAIAKIVGVLCYTLALSSLRGTITVQANKFRAKHRLGMFVPWSEMRIFDTYGFAGTVLGAVITLVTCVLMGSSVGEIGLSVFVTAAAFWGAFFALGKGVNDKIIAYVFNLVIFAVFYSGT